MPQTSTTGNLPNAMRTIIAATRYTEEHNAPAMAAIEHMKLPKGASTVTSPKVGQQSVFDLVDGQDIVDEEEIGMTTVDLTAAEVGSKIILTDKLLRQSVPNIFTVVGRQQGDAMARKKDNDVTALYAGLNGGVTLGAAGAAMSATNLAGAYTFAIANKFGSPLYIIHHPNAIFDILDSLARTPATAAPVMPGFTADLLKQWFTGLSPIGRVPIFQDGNITVNSSDDAVGVIASKGALVVLESVTSHTERQRDASLRGWEVVITADYGVFELDDTLGAPWTCDAAAPSTSA
jgi:hypothetical protein